MALGTAQPQTFLSRVSRTLAAFDSAWKARAPDPGQFYPPTQGQWGGFLQFPGWNILEQRGNSNTVDEKRAKMAVQSPWVFSDIQAIANEASAAELVVKERKAGGLEDIDSHEAEMLWESPNPHMGRSFLISFWIWSYILATKSYLYWMPDSSGRITEIWPIPPFMIAPIPDEKDFIRGYAFKATPGSAAIIIPAEYITFSHSVNIFDVRDGLGFMVAAMLGIESDLAMERWNRNFFEESNGIPDGLISVPRDTLDNDLIRIRSEIRDYFGGTKRGVGVARAGDMEYKAWSRSQKEIEFKEGIELVSKIIGRTLGFPDGYWSETANRANAEQARKTMIAGAVWPLLVRLSEDMNAQTIRRWWGEQYRASFKDIRPEDRELKLKEMTFFSTIETVDELRKRNGIEPIGDVRGLMLLAELNKGAPTPTSAPGQAIEDALAEQEAAAMEAMPEEEESPALVDEETENPEAAADDGAPLKASWIKHGKHDQSTHGRSRGGGSGGVTSKVLPDGHPLLQRFGHDTGVYREFDDPSRADSAFTSMYDGWAKALTDDERDAVRGYQQQTFDGVNGTLRGHRTEDEKTSYFREQTRRIDSALDSSEVPYNVVAYRGMTNPNLAAGDVFADDGFSSTTLAPSIARARAQQLGDQGVVARIRVPQGTKGAYVETVTPIDQAELLLHRGTQYRVISVEPGAIELEVVAG